MKKTGIISIALALILILTLSACDAGSPNAGSKTSIEVGNLNELFRALDDPNIKSIALKPGTYNFSKWLRDEYDKANFDTSNSPVVHDYPDAEAISGKVYILYGSDFIFYRLNNLTIESADPENPAQIVVEDAYATVLSLNQCSDITLSNIVFGHAVEPGHCSGDVIHIDDSDNIEINGCDIYGCGAYGVGIRGSNNVLFNEGVIHDCTYGCVYSWDSSSNFYSTRFADCGVYDMFSAYSSVISFNGCSFSNLVGEIIAVGDFSFVGFYGCEFDPDILEAIQAHPAYGSEIFVTDQ